MLFQIRQRLGYNTKTGYIAPTDIIEHLRKRDILKQSQFEGVEGGDILNPTNLDAFIELLSAGEHGNAPSEQKAAAILYYSGHIISIVKYLAEEPNRVFYDLVDSLPGLQRRNRETFSTRTVCKDVESLGVLLRWYATKKLTDADCHHIDNNLFIEYSEDMGDSTDPRVFQGFVWSDQ
jgi:hypothetical protein